MVLHVSKCVPLKTNAQRNASQNANSGYFQLVKFWYFVLWWECVISQGKKSYFFLNPNLCFTLQGPDL